MENKIIPGRLVSSTAGRDSGRYYLILDLADNGMIRVVNGSERKLASPKKKNVRHLKFHPQVAEEIKAKIVSGERLTDQDIRKALAFLLNGSE